MLSTRPFLVDGRPLLPSLPSHRTLSADTLWSRPFFVDGRPLLPSLPSHRTLYADIRSMAMAVDCCLHRRLRRKLLGLAVDGRVRMLRSLARRRQKMHGVWIFNNITPSHPSHADDTSCARPSMAVGWCLHRRRRRK